MHAQDVFDARAMIQTAEVLSIDDSGQVQKAHIRTSAGATYADIEVIQMYGHSAHPPVDGTLALVFAVGGDPANMRAILYNPSSRFGNQAPGESTTFAPDGTRISTRAGGILDIKAGNEINISAPHIVLTAGDDLAITAPDTTVLGQIHQTGSLHIAGSEFVNGGHIEVNGITVIVP